MMNGSAIRTGASGTQILATVELIHADNLRFDCRSDRPRQIDAIAAEALGQHCEVWAGGLPFVPEAPRGKVHSLTSGEHRRAVLAVLIVTLVIRISVCKRSVHGEHEERVGKQQDEWPDWYADYIVRGQAGKERPS
jgi:hypothetical protein